MGTSMGGMQAWVWGETHADFVDALMPLASLPVPIAGRNRVMRRMILDAIREDPGYQNGEYKEQPRGLQTAVDVVILMGSAPVYWHSQAPTRDGADKFFHDARDRMTARFDANDVAYAFDASREYDPSQRLGLIQAPLVAVNSADDVVNPPELGILEREIVKVPNGKAVILPITNRTRGHGTHSLPEVWRQYLADLLERSRK
jgi:homoserine O-acetyltransferase/O-succinyltransferase